ncbi:thioredoxin domain-containing protein [Alkalihalobacillus sp. FSL R5-0424]
MTPSINMKILIISTLFVIGSLIVGVIFYQNSSSKEINGIEFDQSPKKEGQPIKGDSEAPITITEFGDYKCPSCKAWDETVFPLLERDYINTGKVNLIYINTPFHGEESELAAMAGEYVWDNYSDTFWDFHSKIFEEQPAIESHDDPWITEDKLIDIAGISSERIDQEALRTALQEQMYRDNILTDVSILNEYEIEKTPTIMVENIKLENPFDYELLKQQIDALLEEE